MAPTRDRAGCANWTCSASGIWPARRPGSCHTGQRRLLGIGVALVARPRLLVLDEPAAGLTDADLPALMRCLTRLPRDVTVLLAEHHMDLVTAVADVVTVLHQGSVLAHGSPSEIRIPPRWPRCTSAPPAPGRR